MLRVALASVLGHKLRLGLTALAIVLAVTFVAGSLVLTDSISHGFDQLFAQVNEGVDVYVNGVSEVDGGFFSQQPGQDPTFAADVLDRVRQVDGVQEAVPSLEGVAQVIGPDGDPVGGNGPPTLSFSWSGPDEPGPLTLQEGRPAAGSDEVTIDAGSATTTGYGLGDTVTIQLPGGQRTFTLVGITGFGDQGDVGGTSIVTFDLATAQQLQDEQGMLSSITVIGNPDVDPATLRDRVRSAVDADGIEVVTAQEQQTSDTAEISQGLSFLTIGLLAFAGIAVFVGIFLIVNTFSIIVAQRTREFGLLRAVGASTRQVRLAVVVEALTIGTLSGAVGLGAGIGLAQLVRKLFDAIGFGFPEGGLIIQPRTAIVAMAIGMGVTVVAALGPARRASRVSPMEALRPEADPDRDKVGAGRTAVGLLGVVAGAVSLGLGVADVVPQPAAAAGAGAALAFVGVALLAPYLAGPASAVVGALPARLGLPGRLARNNADGNRKRTASTASALMIGVALVSFVSIFASSATASVNALFTESLGSDFIITSANVAGGGVPPGFADQLQGQPELGAVSPVRFVNAEVDGQFSPVVGVKSTAIEDLASVDVRQGALADLPGGVMVYVDRAQRDGIAAGDAIQFTFPNGPRTLPVVGVFGNNDLLGSNFLLDVGTLDELGVTGLDAFVLADTGPGADPSAARASIESLADGFAGINVQDQTEYTQTLRGQVDGLLNVMIALLGLALLIALIGIVNTLALSVVERTREIGLLRAVGMTRRQVRAMVRWEAVIVSIFGAALGVAVGAVFGWALVSASGDSGLEVLEFPVTRLVVYVVVAAVAGVLAAVLPARRAARLDVLRAVTTE